MSQKIKTILGVAAFAMLLVGAVVAYNALSGRVEPSLDPPPNQAQTVTGFTTTRARDTAPDFAVVDEEGNPVRLSDFRGRPVVLNFWASWCPPCRQEMPEFDSAYKEMGGDVVFMMVDLTDGGRESVATASRFVEGQGYGFPVYFDTRGEAADAYGIMSIPATFFIDGEGRVVSSQVGALSKAALARGIEGIMD